MSRPKIDNKIQDEIIHKIGLLLDKPISPKANKQLIELIDHPSSPKERVLSLMLTKFRGDMILRMVEKYPYIMGSIQHLTDTFANLQKHITKYSTDIINSIYALLIKLIFTNQTKPPNETQQMIYKLSYEDLLKQGLRVTNLEKKDRMFELIHNNVCLFAQLGLKDNLRKVIGTYVEVFRKFPLTVPCYIKTLTLIVNLIAESHQHNDSPQQKDAIKLQTLPEISDDYMTQIILQLNGILISTKEKPLHLLHNQCLICMYKILQNKQYTILQNDVIYSLNKTIEIYLYRKGTRDEARRVQLILSKSNQQLQKLNHQKMLKQYSSSNFSQQINQKPVLIENVIHKTNQFLAKYQVNSIGQNLYQDKNQPRLMNSRFLKKGEGIGGGRAILQINTQVNKDKNYQKGAKNSLIKRKDKFELLLQNCLQRCEWQKNDKNAFINMNNVEQQTNNKIAKTIHKRPNQSRAQLNSQPQQLSYSQFYQQQQPYRQKYDNKRTLQNSNISEQDINEINQLIDLAYSYKFSSM